jgi:alcohol dehydrogenase class IV
MKPFEFATAARILFGAGVVREVPAAVQSMGERPLVVTGASRARAESLIRELDAVVFGTPGEPTLDLIRHGTELARDARCDVVIAIGGGSAIDSGKALAAMITNPGDPIDYLEVVGRGQPLTHAPAPFIAIPTTAGTGSELTRNAVLASPEHKVKASMRSPLMLPDLAVVDPELTLGLPPAVTASTGLDALTQLIEPFVSLRANPMTDMICLEGMREAASSLARAYANGADLRARTGMSWASLLGGMALANAALGAVHGFAAPIGGMFDAPHGAVCAAVLPHAMEVNVRALRTRSGSNDALGRHGTAARILTGHGQATAEDGVRWIAELCRKLDIPPLHTYGVRAEHVSDLVDKAARASSMKGNPVVLTAPELSEILERAL